VSALTLDSVFILTIDKSRFLRIIKRDKPLMKKLEKVLDKQMEAGRTTFIDTTTVREHLQMANGKIITGELALRARKIDLLVKNTIMGILVKNREEKKVASLSEALKTTIEKQKNEKHLDRVAEKTNTIDDLMSNK
jgi:predicted kinase